MLILSVVSFLIVISDGVLSAKLVNIPENAENCVPDCNSSLIFCMGKGNAGGPGTLLHDVQVNNIAGEDGTEFVRKRLKFSEKEILQMYENLKRRRRLSNGILFPDERKQLKEFIDKTFADDSLPQVDPTDFKENPAILDKVDPYFRPWLSELNHLWKNLTKEIPMSLESFEREKHLHSYIYVPNKFVVAGGRFQEMYYWDSYWIIKGLLACEMYDTARGIIENIIYLVEQIGFMPNGNRLYYLRRSQPPMLIQMANDYYRATKNETFIKINLKTFEKEFRWWNENHRIEIKKDGRNYLLFNYNSTSCFPRPESYKEDYKLLTKCTNATEAQKIFTGIRTGAESGWDFSSRHMRDPNNAKIMRDGLVDMAPQEYAYVDLNSIMYSNVNLLAKWKLKFGTDKNMAEYYANFARKMLDSIEKVLWSKKYGIWLDYDIKNNTHRNFFYLSNLLPLWSESYEGPEKVNSAIKYLIMNEMIFPNNLSSTYHGLPTSSLIDSTQQWDFPNVWPPLQSFVIHGLQKSNNAKAREVAINLARAFVKTAFVGYYKSSTNRSMYEKYNARTLGSAGANTGEYQTQTGFGWTNGVIFELFTVWNDLSFSD